jgi:hypothetical protein
MVREVPAVVDAEEEAAEAVVVMAKPEAEEAVVETVKAEEAAVVEIVPLVRDVSPVKVRKAVRENLSLFTPKRRRPPTKPRWPSVMPKLLLEVKSPDVAVEADLRVRDALVVPAELEPRDTVRLASVTLPEITNTKEETEPTVLVVEDVEDAHSPERENAEEKKPTLKLVRRLPPSKAKPQLSKRPSLSNAKKLSKKSTRIPRPCPESPTKST